MDSFFGIGTAELVLILLIAGLVMGPERIRDAARFLGRLTAQLQAISREFTRQLNAELDAIDDGEMKAALSDMKVLQEQVQSLRNELTSLSRETARDVETAVSDAAAEARAAVEPPAPLPDSPPANGAANIPAPLEIEDDPAT